jgi:ribosomal protein S18 acetylase RimI-like enzyme
MIKSRVKRCLPSQRASALRRLNAAQDEGQRHSLAQAALAMNGADETAWDGLFIASPPSSGAIWVQTVPGNTAVIWPPRSGDRAAGELFQAAAAFVDERQIALAQALIGEHEGFSAPQLAEWGFPWLADLRYLFADLPDLPEDRDSPDMLRFHSHAGIQAERLAAIIERTYIATLDCPALDGARPLDDVLAGYRSQGRHMPEHWYVVAHEGRDVGVLLFADHSSAGNWELVYMGLAPEARGRSWGQALVRFALKTATSAGAQRLVLAVDAANEPALKIYRKLRFREWDRRMVFARLRPHA